MTDNTFDWTPLMDAMLATRARIGTRWTMPTLQDAARFTACEAYEFLDAAVLRQRQYARNRANADSAGHELAQTVIMALTAWHLLDRGR